MGASAAVKAIFYTSPDGATWTQMVPEMETDFDFKPVMLPSTYQGQADNVKHEFPGIATGTFSAKGNYDHGDAAQASVVTNNLAGTRMYLKLLFDGTHGVSAPVYITDCKIGGSAETAASFNATFQIDGAPTVI